MALASDQALLRTDTRTIALAWIEANIPQGAAIVREEFTPQVPNAEYRVGATGYLLASRSLEWYREAGFEYVVASSYSFNRFIGIAPQDAFYRSLLAQPVVLDLRPQPGQPGPEIVVVKLSEAPSGARPLVWQAALMAPMRAQAGAQCLTGLTGFALSSASDRDLPGDNKSDGLTPDRGG